MISEAYNSDGRGESAASQRGFHVLIYTAPDSLETSNLIFYTKFALSASRKIFGPSLASGVLTANTPFRGIWGL